MAKRCAILLLWITIGTSAQAQDCFYRKEILYTDGTTIEAMEQYDCKNSSPPEVIIIEKAVESPNKSVGDFLFGAESNQGISK